MESIMSNTNEIISLVKVSIHDKSFASALLETVFKGRGHSARIMSESLREKFPHNKAYTRIDDLITEMFFE